MLYLMCFIAGFVFGAFLVFTISKKKPLGYLRIDHSDPMDSPYLFLELKTDVENITDKKEVLLMVKRENFISQK